MVFVFAFNRAYKYAAISAPLPLFRLSFSIVPAASVFKSNNGYYQPDEEETALLF
jgi:hypothetical protein